MLYSHLAEQGAVHFSPLKWPYSSVLTPCKQGAVHFFPAQFAIKNPPE